MMKGSTSHGPSALVAYPSCGSAPCAVLAASFSSPTPSRQGRDLFMVRLDRSADFQSAVSPNSIRQSAGPLPRGGVPQRLAECNSAIQQSATLRYDGLLNRCGGRGRIVHCFVTQWERFECSQRRERQRSVGSPGNAGSCSLSPRERVRVRGDRSVAHLGILHGRSIVPKT